jgi:protein-tyrosine-phosphatase
MREVGVDLTGQRPKSLVDISNTEFDVVVGLGCGDEGCPLIRARRRERRDIPDPKSLTPEQFRAVRDLIGQKVKKLLATL